MVADFGREYEGLLRRVQAIERWMQAWGNSDRRMKDLYATDLFVNDITADLIRGNEGFIVDATRGLGANFYKQHDPASQEFAVGFQVLQTEVPEATEYHSIIPVRWTIPAKVGNIDTHVIFVFTDDTTITRTNATGSDITESHAATLYFNKDGLPIKRIEFAVTNVAGSPETQDLAAFTLGGWQV